MPRHPKITVEVTATLAGDCDITLCRHDGEIEVLFDAGSDGVPLVLLLPDESADRLATMLRQSLNQAGRIPIGTTTSRQEP